MAVDIAAVVRSYHSCDKNGVNLRDLLNRLKLFSVTLPLESVVIGNLRPLSRTRSEKPFLLLSTDRFTKLIQVAALAKTTVCFVLLASLEVWVFKCEIPVSLLSENRPQFAAQVFPVYMTFARHEQCVQDYYSSPDEWAG